MPLPDAATVMAAVDEHHVRLVQHEYGIRRAIKRGKQDDLADCPVCALTCVAIHMLGVAQFVRRFQDVKRLETDVAFADLFCVSEDEVCAYMTGFDSDVGAGRDAGSSLGRAYNLGYDARKAWQRRQSEEVVV